MIAYLKGKIIEKSVNFLIIETGNIGYKVFTIPELLEKKIGDEIPLFIYHKSTDEGQTLFGVPDFKTLQFFELLLSVSGVGPKMALTIVSAAKIEALSQAILAQDAEIFTRMSGLGKKTAERIILELKNKIASGGLEGVGSSAGTDIYDALIGLGYNPREVREIIPKIDGKTDMEVQLKQALKLLSK